MGDLAADTAVERVDGDGGGDKGEAVASYRATLSKEWEIWGPMGGYVASVALRAAGDASPFDRPASFFCQYLGVARFEPVDITVRTLRAAKTAHAQRVEVAQAGKLVVEATVWSTGDVHGLEHDATAPLYPDVELPANLPDLVDLLTAEELEQGPPFAFWNNFDVKPIGFRRDDEPSEPRWQEWLRFLPTATFDDPWVDACRSLVLVDLQSWPSVAQAHRRGHGYIAPSLDLYVAFHDPDPASEWLLADGYGPVAKDGLMAWNGRLWSESGRLVASGTGQLLCRKIPTG